MEKAANPFLYRPTDPGLIDYVDEVRRFKARSPRTMSEYVRELENFGRFLHDIPIRKPGGKRAGAPEDPRVYPKLPAASKADVLRYLRKITDRRDFKPMTVRRTIFALRSYYRTLVQMGRRDDDPTAGVPIVEKAKEQRDPKQIPQAEMGKLLRTRLPESGEFQRLRDVAMLELLYATGVRRAEVISIQVDAIDWELRSIRVSGKGGKKRTVLFNEATEAALRAWMAVRPRAVDNTLFTGEKGAPLSHSYVGTIFRRYLDRSGLPLHATPHAMRHSFALHLLKNGADIVTISNLLGHASLDTTKIYLEMTDLERKAVYDRSHPRDREKLR